MNSSTIALPTKDQYTTYDYSLGAVRLSAVKNNQIQIEYLDEMVQALAFQSILENPFNEELRAAVFSGQCRQKICPQLKVTYRENEITTKIKVNALTREKTVEFANKAVASWGTDAEKVLSATETGSLYWNVIHHFESFDTFLLDIGK